MHISIRQLYTLDAIITKGSFKAAADALHRSHPSIMAAVKKLEEELGFDLFDRSGYRVVLTQRGTEFYKAVQPVLEEYAHLSNKVEVLQSGGGQQLNIAIGDVTPPELVTNVLKYFKEVYPEIQLNLFSENLMGVQERLFDDKVDIIFHHVDQSDASVEVIALGKVAVVPVAAPGFIRCEVSPHTSYSALKEYMLCVIRCTATHSQTRDYFVVDGSPRLTVDDQLMKKQVIMSGMAWGHMPEYLIREELAEGRLKSLAGKNIKEHTLEIVAARRFSNTHGATARLFWELLKKRQGPHFDVSAADRVTCRKQTNEIV